jgi:hypothetical protein
VLICRFKKIRIGNKSLSRKPKRKERKIKRTALHTMHLLQNLKINKAIKNPKLEMSSNSTNLARKKEESSKS